ncbi:DUF4214 domain-containing protein [Pseudoduganella lutea]|uniref:DUF4214 domain-containing protein n=1 Tax=Pseudoduganella lutea TaxID=321985 RepID=UPI0013EEA419|nr:DUF4214 domain-containing protein [Pseudoduganella lutea]
MSTIDFKWSAAAAQLHAHGQSRLETALGNAIDSLLPTDSDVARATFDIGGSALTAYLGNGATLAVGGLGLGLGLGQSVITADNLHLYRAGVGSIELPGQYAIRYALVNGAPQIQGFTGQVSSVAITSQWQPGSAGYDAAIGNVSVRATGSLALDESLAVRGRLTELAFSTTSGIMQGSVQGDFVAGGQGDFSSATVTAANFSYADGSFLRAGDARIDASDLTLSGVAAALGNAANFGGDDVFNLDVATSDILPMIDSGYGNDRIVLTGGADFNVATGAGDDVVTLLKGRSSIQGGDGFDTAVIAGKQADFSASQMGTWNVFIGVGSNEGHSASLQSVERVLFDDGAVAFDIDGHAGQAYRLYTAALGRAPDAAGLGYWVSVLDSGASLRDVANGFVAGDEFASLVVGADSTTFLVKLYGNILHRAPDTSGLQYWQGILDGGGDRAEVVAAFSESTENQAQVIADIQHGIAYTPYG